MNERDKTTTFAENVFDENKMQKYLPKAIYLSVISARENHTLLNSNELDVYANAIFNWAKERGVTRFTHWFQPLRGYAAEKRDSFYSIDCQGLPIGKFRGKELTEGEGDASSFPNGGLRQTFEARGISQIDLTTYAFIKDGCLCVPTVFRSSNGCSLDKKTPLLRSEIALNKQATRVLKLLGEPCAKVINVVGAEQEYFLVDKRLFERRLDLKYVGRTLFGAKPPKGQEFCDHYFRAIPQNVAEFMKEVDEELWKLGIIVKTEHNEVAPKQFELAPCYTAASIQCEQNLIIMETLQKIAEKHNLVCLLHEKPFSYFNGSGKHNNWSLVTENGDNLFEMGSTPRQKTRFMLFVAAVIKAVDEYADVLAAATSSYANDLRLGGHEAPPQTVSVSLGGLQNVGISNDDWDKLTYSFTDRNRTSPFAFTGNKFEYRAVGSSANIADVNTALNTAVAESLRQFADALEQAENPLREAKRLVSETYEINGRRIFDGNCYSPEWKREAKLRKLESLSAVDAFKSLSLDKNIELFTRHGVLTRDELLARQRVLVESYCNTASLEALCAAEIAERQIIPAAEEYSNALAAAALNKVKLCVDIPLEKRKLDDLTRLSNECFKQAAELKTEIDKSQNIEDASKRAKYLSQRIPTGLDKLRKTADGIESLVPKDMLFPTYGDLLFV